LGVGGASLAAAGISAIVRAGAKSDLESACPNYQAGCGPDVKSTVDRGKLAATLTNVFAVSGVALAGTGVAVVLVSGPTKSANVAIAPRVGPGGVFATLVVQ
jgi:hypothetical protein